MIVGRGRVTYTGVRSPATVVDPRPPAAIRSILEAVSGGLHPETPMSRPDPIRMLDAARQMSDIRDLEPLVAFVLAEARALTGARRGSLILFESEPLVPAPLHFGQDDPNAGSSPVPTRPAAWELALLCDGPTWLPRDGSARPDPACEADSTLCLPLRYRGVPQGAIVLERPDGAAQTDLAELPAGFGEHASVCIRNALLNRRMEAEIRYLSEYDTTVTKLPNRIVFRRALAEAIGATNPAHYLAVLFIDLDHFEAVNRRFGHRAGDQFLFKVAQRLARFARSRGLGSTPARIGGDEFALSLTGLTAPQDAHHTALELLEDIRSPFDLGGSRYLMTASIGIGLYPQDGSTAEDVLLHADQAMYAAKARGGDSWSPYSPPPDPPQSN
jgi:diguanylate cyclase (GGDEF)-like protein